MKITSEALNVLRQIFIIERHQMIWTSQH